MLKYQQLGILTFMSRWHLNIYEHDIFSCSVKLSTKKVYNFRTREGADQMFRALTPLFGNGARALGIGKISGVD